jgi:MFS family permease
LDKKNERVFLALFFATFFAMFGETLPLSFQPLFIRNLGLSASLLTLLYNIRNIIQTVLRLIAGTISDALGRRNMMIFGLTLFALVPFIYSIAQNTWIAAVAMMTSGFALSIYFPPSEAYASSLFPPEKSGEVMGRYHMSWAISSVIGPSIGGFIAGYLGYRMIFTIAGVITTIGLFISWRYTEDDRDYSCPLSPVDQIRTTFSDFPGTMSRLMKNKKILVASIAVFAHSFAHWGLPTFIPLLGEELGMSEFFIGITLTANSLMIAIALPLVGRISDRIGRFLPIVVGLGISVFAFALIPILPNFWLFPIVNGILGICAVMVFPVSQAATMESLPSTDRGSATGVWGMVMSLGGTLGLFTMSGVLAVADIQWVFYLSAIFTAVLTVIIFIMKEYFE